MHHNELLTLKISQAANEILMRTHDEYNNMVIGFQGYQDILCTLFSKSRDHLYRICGLLHLLHQACSYVLKVEPQLQYLVFDDIAAESIQKMATLAQRNIDEYLTISPDIAQTTVELMKFYVDTKKLLYGFPLITIPPSEQINIGPSISQQIHTTEQDTELNNPVSNIVNMDNQSVLSNYSGFSNLSSSICPFNGSTVDASIKKILFYHNRVISSTRLAQILRRQTNGTAESVPMFDILRSTLYRDRATVLPKLPLVLNDLILPENFTKNLYNEKMLFCDQKQPSRILAFASLTALKHLAQCNTWNADGTFKTAPKLFSQAYTIHAHNEFSMKPIVFAALPDKYEQTYLTLLQALVVYAQTNDLILSPTSILIDFELAAFNAFRRMFPNANILFCHFHFAKNIMKYLKQLQLKKETVKREIANILSLPLLPTNKIISAFYDSKDVLQSMNLNFQKFLNYIEKTYIINAQFNSLNWNHYVTLSNRPRTNNQ
ncbi:unnamed protein product [Rotaria sordida]|uniref:MULE transposase domain-containing protein n=3 Tax=Rotaria sordida TaxID=392033 RepID=A0A815TUK3_9BILA|nr:unnamed protein product [Rotaria sordida]